MDTSTPTGKLVLTMLAGVAEFEKSQINERTKNGKKARAKTSDYANGGQPKFGHKADNKNLVVDDKEQQIIDVIRRHHKSGNCFGLDDSEALRRNRSPHLWLWTRLSRSLGNGGVGFLFWV